MPRILISYRRRDSAAITGRLYDRLVQRYGASSLFLDIDNIPYGPDFRQHVRDALSQTDLVLLVIGPDWVGRRTGRLPRIADDSDPVRIEIETTLQAKIPLLPILVDGASPPDEGELPSSLHDLPFLNAIAVSSGRDFSAHVQRLIGAINDTLSKTGKLPKPPMKGIVRLPVMTPLAIVIVVVRGGVALPFVANFAMISPPWPPHSSALAAIVEFAAIALFYFGLKGPTTGGYHQIWILASCTLGILILVYLWAVSTFTYELLPTKERWVKGYECTDMATTVFKDRCPYLGLNELRSAEYNAEQLWTTRSIAVVSALLMGTWLIIFINVGFRVASFLARYAELKRLEPFLST